jgi:hypothetical protein
MIFETIVIVDFAIVEVLSTLIHERGRVVAKGECVGVGRDVFEISPTFPVPRLLDRSFDLSQKSFVV